jgi:hypothetical protein
MLRGLTFGGHPKTILATTGAAGSASTRLASTKPHLRHFSFK